MSDKLNPAQRAEQKVNGWRKEIHERTGVDLLNPRLQWPASLVLVMREVVRLLAEVAKRGHGVAARTVEAEEQGMIHAVCSADWSRTITTLNVTIESLGELTAWAAFLGSEIFIGHGAWYGEAPVELDWTCPHCKVINGGWAEIHGVDDRKPANGDFFVCAYCRAALRIELCKLRFATLQEVLNVAPTIAIAFAASGAWVHGVQVIPRPNQAPARA
jgi:hypothetical protein